MNLKKVYKSDLKITISPESGLIREIPSKPELYVIIKI